MTIEDEETDDLKRDDFALRLLCAFNGVDPALAPPEWWFYPNPSVRDGWKRVAAEALSSAERRIEELVRERDGWKAEASLQQAANSLYREALDERNEFKNRMRAAEALVTTLKAEVEELKRRPDMLKQLLDDANAAHFDATMRAGAAEDSLASLKACAKSAADSAAAIRSLPVLPTTGDGGGPEPEDRAAALADIMGLSFGPPEAPTGRETSGEET